MSTFFRKLLRCFGWLLLFYFLYALIFGIFSYLLPVHPREPVSSHHFLSESPGPDRAALVETPKDAFSRRIELIRSAQNTLDVTCHCVKTGETSDCFFAEVLKAADRGVKVRVLLDGAIGGLAGPHADIALALRAHPNIEYRGYNPIHLLKPWEWNVRLHDKFLLADDRFLMLGGRNIGDEYFDPPEYQGTVAHDRDVIVVNTAAGQFSDSAILQVQTYMDELWNAKGTEGFAPLSKRKEAAGLKEQERLRQLSSDWEARYPDYYVPSVPIEAMAVPTRRITLLHNPLGVHKKAPDIGTDLTALLKTCSEIRIQSPYATASRGTLHSMSEIASVATVDYLTNSMASTPNFPAFSAYITRRQKFVDTGIRIHEYQSRHSIHGKSCVADDHISVVGSYNLDDRSIYIDTESVLVIDSPAFFELLDSKLNDLFAQSAEVGRDNRYIENSSVEILDVSLGRRVLMGAVSLFSRLFQYLI